MPSSPITDVKRYSIIVKKLARRFPFVNERTIKSMAKYSLLHSELAAKNFKKNHYFDWFTKREEIVARELAYKEKVKRVFGDSYGTYGLNRICAALRKQGEKATYHKVG